jgi:redox-sensitive bicupin YhaK (pirin superfamily)
VTYLLSGRNEHRDSAGHTGVVAAGGAQWMTAGRGIVHAERPLAESDNELTMHGIQLWTSLPRALKLMAPRYQRIEAHAIPEVAANGVRTRVIAGELGDAKGPAATLMPTFLWHVRLDAGAVFEAPIPDGYEAGVYVIGGEARVGDGTRVTTGQLAVLVGTQGALAVENDARAPLDVMVLGGTPAEGPLVFHGPFVMNNVEQVRAAEIAYRTGRMGEIE